MSTFAVIVFFSSIIVLLFFFTFFISLLGFPTFFIFFKRIRNCLCGSPVPQTVKHMPANAGDTGDTGSISGLGIPLEKGMATHSSIFVWRIPWIEQPGGL